MTIAYVLLTLIITIMYYIVTFPLKIAWVNWPVMCYLQQLLWQIDIFLDNLVLDNAPWGF